MLSLRKLAVSLAVGAKYHWLIASADPLDLSLWLIALEGWFDVDIKYLTFLLSMIVCL